MYIITDQNLATVIASLATASAKLYSSVYVHHHVYHPYLKEIVTLVSLASYSKRKVYRIVRDLN